MTELGIITRTILSATAPYDLRSSLRALADFRPAQRDIALDPAGSVRRAFPHPSDPEAAVVVEVAERDDGAPGAGLTVFSADPLDGPDLDAVRRRVSAWLGLDDDRAEFLTRADADEPVRPLLALARGLHQVRFSSLAEGVVYFTLLQNSTQWFATLGKRRLTLYFGIPASVDGQDFTAIPDLPSLSRLTAFEVRPFVQGRNKAERLVQVLAGVAALDEELLRTGPYGEARDALLSVRGIGDYTAHALLLRVLGRPDAVPLEMEQYRHTARAVYGEDTPSPDELREWYGPWIGWWAYTCRAALTWIDQDRTERERAERTRRRSASARRPRSTAWSTHPPRSAPRHPAPWSPQDPGCVADDLATAAPRTVADDLAAIEPGSVADDLATAVPRDLGNPGGSDVAGLDGLTAAELDERATADLHSLVEPGRNDLAGRGLNGLAAQGLTDLAGTALDEAAASQSADGQLLAAADDLMAEQGDRSVVFAAG
ncbi:DNA-3-methyladenine glycosylase family protein [Dactylosporangium sp. CS-047395]|uniref:DNA-3-methyladenine glycosylase family protein n=1 Tax=Dactylosporangium sp. CS-047395 TaxID=3239936 RepID=UPI003D8DC9F5